MKFDTISKISKISKILIFLCLIITIIIIIFLAINKLSIARFENIPSTTTIPSTTIPPTTTMPSTLPEITNPEIAKPEITNPEITKPEITNPEITKPEITKTEITKPTTNPTSQINSKPTPTFDNTYKAPNCIEKDNISGVCNNYTNCCVNTNTCLCSNPLVKNCKSDYEKCVSSNGTDCDNILKKCCNGINTLKIDATKFDNSFKNNQTEGMYCMVNTVSNPQINCMGICQYDDKCKAFSIDTMNNCMFFNKFEPSGDKTNNLSNNFYIKKD